MCDRGTSPAEKERGGRSRTFPLRSAIASATKRCPGKRPGNLGTLSTPRYVSQCTQREQTHPTNNVAYRLVRHSKAVRLHRLVPGLCRLPPFEYCICLHTPNTQRPPTPDKGSTIKGRDEYQRATSAPSRMHDIQSFKTPPAGHSGHDKKQHGRRLHPPRPNNSDTSTALQGARPGNSGPVDTQPPPLHPHTQHTRNVQSTCDASTNKTRLLPLTRRH